MTTETFLLSAIVFLGVVSYIWLVTRIDALRDDIADVERLVRRVADELDIDADED